MFTKAIVVGVALWVWTDLEDPSSEVYLRSFEGETATEDCWSYLRLSEYEAGYCAGIFEEVIVAPQRPKSRPEGLGQ